MVRALVVGISTLGALVLILGCQVLFTITLHNEDSLGHRLEDAEIRLNFLESVAGARRKLNSSHGIASVGGTGPEKSVAQLTSRVLQLEHQVQSLLQELHFSRLGTQPVAFVDGCHGELGKFQSSEEMTAAGWIFHMTGHQFGDHFNGWSDGYEIGVMQTTMRASGRLNLHVFNSHITNGQNEDEEIANLVKITLNWEEIVLIPGNNHAELCLMVQVGDEVAISEYYGKILLSSVDFECGVYDDGILRGATQSIESKECAIDQGTSVWVPSVKCDSGLIEGTFDRVLNETRAVVTMGGGAEARWQIFDAKQIATSEEGSVRCKSFPFKREPHGVGIILVADSKFEKRYGPLIQTQRCYAAARGYQHIILRPFGYSACMNYTDVFFNKHCIISTWLAKQPEGYVAAVVDADVIALALERGLEEWYLHESDVHFYERDWNTEIMAGNYMVRNTANARRFLMGWADFNFNMPIGYCSSDNGAIHLHLLEVLQIEGAGECRKRWDNLVSPPTDLTDYFNFVECCKQRLGRPRTWNVQGGWKLTVWPKFSFWSLDSYYVDNMLSNVAGAVMVHGVKNVSWVSDRFYTNLSQCVPNYDKAVRSRGEVVARMLRYARGARMPDKHNNDNSTLYPAGDGCVQCVERCMANFSCRPLMNDEADGVPLPRRTCKNC
jgi:hypothetical protein